VEGDLSAEGPDLPSLLALAGALQVNGLAGLAAQLATATDKAFTFATRFAFDGPQARLAVPALTLGAYGLGLDGTLAASGLGGGSATVVDGALSLKGRELTPLLTALGQADLAKSVRSLDFTTKLAGKGDTLTLRPLEATLGLVRPGGSAPLDLKLTLEAAEADLKAHTASVHKLALTGIGLFVKGDLQAAQLDGTPILSGALSAPEFNLRDVLSVLNMPATHLQDPAALTRIAVDTRITGTDGAFSLKPLTLKLDDATISGEFTLRSQAGLELAFDLRTDMLDIDRYLAGANGKQAPPVTPEAAAAGAALLPLATLRAIRLDGRFAADRLKVSGLALARVKVAVQGRDGRLALNPAEADLYGGRYSGTAALDATGSLPALTINTTLAKVGIEPLLTDLNGRSDLTGQLNFEARLATTGSDSTALRRGLNGAGSFAVTDGELRGVDVPGVLKAAELMLESRQLQVPPAGGTTRFQSLTGSLEVRDGAIFNRDLLLDGLGFKVSGEGMLANLADMTSKYDAAIHVDQDSLEQGAQRYALGDYDIPIRCRGKLSGTSCLPDLGELGRRVALKAVKDKVGEKLERSLEGAGEALKKLLKF
jgi:AsmA protein